MADFRNPRKPTPVRKKDGGTTKFYRPLKENESVKVKKRSSSRRGTTK
jgi:hypothetical protein